MRQILDSPSLITGQIILSSLYVCIFLLAAKRYRTLRGTCYFAGAYLCIMLAQVSYFGLGLWQAPPLCTLGDALAAVGSAIEYLGLQEYFDDVNRLSRRLAWAGFAIVALLSIVFLLHPRFPMGNGIVYCIYYFCLRLGMARLLLRHASGDLLVSAFAITMIAFTIYTPNQIILSLLRSHGIVTIFGIARIEIVFLLANIVFSTLIGFFLLFLVVHRLMRDLEQESLSDPLTGKLNRRALDRVLRRELARALREKTSVSVVLIDLDNFKAINDGWGHAAGDEAIRSVAALIEAHVRPYDQFGRHGGDELMIIMPSTEGEQAISIAERICNKVSELTPQYGMHLSLSIGVTQSVRHDSPDALLQRADSALYQAKNEGRSRVRFLPFSAPLPDGSPR
ncbi:MAG TPA: GGDEF domain-containing protein [Edaphobacter sp.]